MKIVERLYHARRIETRRGIVKVTLVAQDRPQFASQTALHQHVQILAILERLVQLDNELAVRLAHDLLFAHDVLLLARLNDLGFLHLFECERTGAVVVQLNEFDATETADAQRGEHSQVGQLDAAELFVDSVRH